MSGVTLDTLSDTPYNRKWKEEIAAYDAMWPQLLKTQKGKWVAVHGGKIVDSDRSQEKLINRVYTKFSRRTPIYFEKVVETRYEIFNIPGIDSE
jgi:hypothetical protein